MSNRSITLLDAAFSAMPIYDYLQSQSRDLFVVGSRSNDVLAKKAGKRWVAQDYSDVEAVREWLNAKRCTSIVPGCTDVSLSVAAELAISPHIDSKSTIDVFNNKAKFRELCAYLKIPTPAGCEITELPASGHFISKPADSFSGRGITVFNGEDLNNVESALATARSVSPTRTAVIEDFIDGQLYSYSLFLKDQSPTVSFFVKEGSSANKFAVDTSFVVYDLPEKICLYMEQFATKIARHLHLVDGLLHIQFIQRGEDIFLIEATRRCPGDLYSMLIELSTGYPYAAHYASCFLGLRMEACQKFRRFIVRHTVSSLQHSINSGLCFIKPVNAVAFYPLQQIGETLLPNQKARAGVLFIEGSTIEAAKQVYGSFLSRSIYVDA